MQVAVTLSNEQIEEVYNVYDYLIHDSGAISIFSSKSIIVYAPDQWSIITMMEDEDE